MLTHLVGMVIVFRHTLSDKGSSPSKQGCVWIGLNWIECCNGNEWIIQIYEVL